MKWNEILEVNEKEIGNIFHSMKVLTFKFKKLQKEENLTSRGFSDFVDSRKLGQRKFV